MKKYQFFGIEYTDIDIQKAIDDLDNNKYSNWSTKQIGNLYNIKSPKGNLYAPKRVFECLAKNSNLNISSDNFGSTEHLRNRLEEAGFIIESYKTENLNEKYGVKWVFHKALKNDLYILFSKKDLIEPWYILVQNDKNETIFLARHNSANRKPGGFYGHITTTPKAKNSTHVIYENQAEVNKYSNQNKKYNDYSQYFVNCNFYVVQESQADVIFLIDSNMKNYMNSKTKNSPNIDKLQQEKKQTSEPLNLILYGPSGTGKTYSTILKTMSIIDGTEYKDVSDEKYKELKNNFDELKQKHQIEFVTFHKSFSYEDFVEGIKPHIPEWGSAENSDVQYVGTDGIFKLLCKRAEQKLFIKNDEQPINYASFENVFEEFKNKYPQHSTCGILQDLTYINDNFIGYKFGNQTQVRKIDIKKIKTIFDKNTEYTTAIGFNTDYEGNSSLACYYYCFYKELNNIRNNINKTVQNKISKNINKEFSINNNAEKYILIIDEINRGEVSEIFGELITLIEEDKRIGNKYEMKTTLPYSKEQFGVPKNLYIIGTMNTADRTISLLDTALRRRFDFEEIMPNPDLLDNKVINGINLTTLLKKINKRITDKYGRNHQIGHSYLMSVENAKDLERAYKNRILPLLNEYFYDDTESVAEILNCTEKELEQKDCIYILNNAQREKNGNK